MSEPHDLNERIAKLMGFSVRPARYKDFPFRLYFGKKPIAPACRTERGAWDCIFERYDTDAKDALTLIAALHEEGWYFQLTFPPTSDDEQDAETFYRCEFSKLSKSFDAFADTMPMAVSLAFLAVKEAK